MRGTNRERREACIYSLSSLTLYLYPHLSVSSFYSVPEEEATLTLMSLSPGVWSQQRGSNFLKIILFVLFPFSSFRYISLSLHLCLSPIFIFPGFITCTYFYEMFNCICQTLQGHGDKVECSCFSSELIVSRAVLQWTNFSALGTDELRGLLFPVFCSPVSARETDLSNKSALNKSL